MTFALFCMHFKIKRWVPLKTFDFDGLTVSLTAQMLGNMLKYLRNEKNKIGLSGRKKRVLSGVPLLC